MGDRRRRVRGDGDLAKTEIVWLFLAAGAFGVALLRRRPAALAAVLGRRLLPGRVWSRRSRGSRGPGSGSALGSMGLFFAKASAFTFGSGLAIVPFLHQGLVHDHHWLTEQQFVDAVAMGLISPGPVVIMATFAGYLVVGITGALIATAAVFLPVYLFVIVPGRCCAATASTRGCRGSSRARPRPPPARSPAPRS